MHLAPLMYVEGSM